MSDLILLTFPDDDNAVTFPPEPSYGSSVSTSIVTKFGYPKLAVRFGYCGPQATLMMMPKAPVYENGPAFRAIRKIGAAGKLLDVFAIVGT